MAKPFLKWAGGKSELLKNILDGFPKKINNYHEPFLGGGSVLIGYLNSHLKKNRVYASDLNESLIITYNVVKEDIEKLIANLIQKEDYYTSADVRESYGDAKSVSSDKFTYSKYVTRNGRREKINIKPPGIQQIRYKEDLYYHYRNKFNAMDKKDEKQHIEIAALFIFLNRTGFRGMYREGPNGFNIPFGSYENPTICDSDNLKKVSKLFNAYDVQFLHRHYNYLRVDRKDFVYMDPPYYPLPNKKSFTSYNYRSGSSTRNAAAFDATEHDNMLKKVKSLSCLFMMSNSSTDYILTNYKNYNIRKLQCSRRINCKHPQSTAMEVLVTNY